MKKLRVLKILASLMTIVAILMMADDVRAQSASTAPIDNSPRPSKKDYSATWSTDLEAEQSQDSLSNQLSQVELGLTMTLDMQFSPWMSLNLTPKVVAQNGFIQTPDLVNPDGSRIDIVNASLDFKPSNYFQPSLGSLYQRTFHADIFMSKRSFPALRLLSQVGSEKDSHFYAFAESAIPTSSSLSNNNQDLGSTPSLNTAGVGFQLGSEQKKYLVTGFFNTYQYAGLSQDLATASVLLGNSGISTSGANYDFQFGYQGYEANIDAQFRLLRSTSIDLYASALENTLAPSGQNLGWDAGGSVKYDFSKTLQLEPRFDYYHIEADSTVAVYNDPMMSTNREGYRTQMKFYYNHKVHLNVSYGQRVPIMANPAQPSETWYGLGLETENAKF